MSTETTAKDTSKEIMPLIQNILAEKNRADLAEKLSPAVPIESLEMDSLDTVEMLMAIEDHLDFQFDEIEVTKAKTIGDLVRLAQRRD